MDFHPFTTNREACSKSGLIDTADEFYTMATAEAISREFSQFYQQLAKARDAIIVISDLLQSKDSEDIAAPSESWQAPPPIPQQKSSPAVPETQPSVSVEEIDSEKLAKAQFERARQLAHDGDREGAISVLQDILRNFPGTQAAEIAKKNLGKTHGHTPPA